MKKDKFSSLNLRRFHIHKHRGQIAKGASKTKRTGLIQNTVITTVGSLTTRSLTVLAMIAISNKVGAEGAGVYGLMMTIYYMAYMFASAGITTSVSRLIAEVISKQCGSGASRLMRTFFIIGGVMSMMMATLLFVYVEPISLVVLRDTRSVEGLRILALSIPFMTLSACYKGYFYGVRKVINPVSAEIFEQLIKLMLITIFLSQWGDRGIASSCAAIAMGMVMGEVLSFSYLTILYIGDKGRQVGSHVRNLYEPVTLGTILKVLCPLALTAYIGGTLMTVEQALIPQGLQASGRSSAEALSAYGIITGMVTPILFFPASFLGAGSTVLIPEIAKAKALGWHARVVSLTHKVMHFTLMVAIFVVAIFSIYSYELGMMIYHNSEVGKYMLMLVFMVPFVYIDIVVDSLLKGLGEQNSCLFYRTIDSLGRVSLMYFLVPLGGIYAVIGIQIGMSIVTASLILIRLSKVTGMKMQWSKWLNYPLLAAVGCTLTSKVMMQYLMPQRMHFTVKILGALALATAMYIVFLVLLESITKEDLKMFR